MVAAPEYPPRLKVENRWVRKCAVLQVCFGQQGGDLAEIGEISNWPSALMSTMLCDKIPPEWCAKSCHLHWVIVYDFNVWIQQKSTLPKSQSPIQGTTKYERLSKYKKKINPSLRCKPGPAIIRVKFPDYKKGICQKLNQSQKARQLQLKVLNWTWEISFTLAAWSATNTVKDNFIKYYFICLTYRRSIYCLSNYNLSWTLPPTPTPPHGLSSAKQKI